MPNRMTTTLEQQIKAIETVKSMMEELKRMHFCTEKRCIELTLALNDAGSTIAAVRFTMNSLSTQDNYDVASGTALNFFESVNRAEAEILKSKVVLYLEKDQVQETTADRVDEEAGN